VAPKKKKSGLTAAQKKKLPASLQKAILRKKSGKKR
jgi:hypothetical protein